MRRCLVQDVIAPSTIYMLLTPMQAEKLTYLANLIPHDMYTIWIERGLTLDNSMFDAAIQNARLQKWHGHPYMVAFEDDCFCRQISIVESMGRPPLIDLKFQSVANESTQERNALRRSFAFSLMDFGEIMACASREKGFDKLIRVLSMRYGMKLFESLGYAKSFSTQVRTILRTGRVGEERSLPMKMFCLMSPSVFKRKKTNHMFMRTWGLVNLFYAFCNVNSFQDGTIQECIAASMRELFDDELRIFVPNSVLPGFSSASLTQGHVENPKSECVLEMFEDEIGQRQDVFAHDTMESACDDKDEEEAVTSSLREEGVFQQGDEEEKDLIDDIGMLSVDVLDILYDTQTQESLFH